MKKYLLLFVLFSSVVSAQGIDVARNTIETTSQNIIDKLTAPVETTKNNLPKCKKNEQNPCILPIKNTTNQNKKIEDFFEVAAQTTGRQLFLIRIENNDLKDTIIPAGETIDIVIPPLR